MRTTFGYTVKELNDKFVLAAEESLRISALSGRPGRWFVDSFPACERHHSNRYSVTNHVATSKICTIVVPWSVFQKKGKEMG